MSWWNNWYVSFLSWRVRHIKERNFIVILSLLVGIIPGLAGVFLKNSVHYTHQFLTERLQIDSGSLLFFILPFIGIWLTSLFVRYFVREDISHGVTKVLYAISRRNSMIKPHNNYSSMIASTITIGFGGSVGTEATIVLTGASIGSNMARFFHMNYKVMTLMIGCGAAGAIAGIFKAPIAGIVFTLEVLMLDLTMASLVPLMIAAISSYVIVYFLMGEGVVLEFAVHEHFALANVPYYIILGILCGLVSVYFIRTNIRIEKFITGIKNQFKRILVGGALLGLLIYIFPPLYGEGYSSLEALLTDNADALLNNTYFFDFRNYAFVVVLYVIGLVFIKVVATAFTNGSGGVGGVFAPSLFTGGVTGFLIAYLINMLRDKGVLCFCLNLHDHTALIYVVRLRRLQADLSDPAVGEFLSSFGYTSKNAIDALLILRQHLMQSGTFPHEIGIFLGYPLADVKGFIINHGHNCLCCGDWKVYSDPENAVKTFRRYCKCKQIYRRMWEQGKDLRQLTVSA